MSIGLITNNENLILFLIFDKNPPKKVGDLDKFLKFNAKK